MAELVLGPLLRYVDATDATIWVETDAACEVEALGHRARTFAVEGHHYALVCIENLAPASRYEYSVALDGVRVWPEADTSFPPSVIRTFDENTAFKLAFGSCRVAMPLEPPYTLTKRESEQGFEIDALYALSHRLHGLAPDEWPHALFLLGDQVYADEVAPDTLDFIRTRRDITQPPGKEIADFEEYTRLYRDSWTQPEIRWLLANIPSAMIFDDHDVHDDWNISASWVADMRAKPWWHARITGAFMSYWIYQHLGNLSPRALAQDELYQTVRQMNDAGAELRAFAERADRERNTYWWSYHRDFGKTRLLVIDSRAGRALEPDRRSMVSGEEWEWIRTHAQGDFDHLLLGTSLPALLGPGIHYLEAWNEAVCAGAWGAWAAKKAEKIRRWVDLEHWSAFQRSFKHLIELLRTLASGGRAPATITFLSGDVHHTYLVEARFGGETPVKSRIYQAVCSPFRNPLGKKQRRTMHACWLWPLALPIKAAARLAGIERPAIAWRRTHDDLWFDNVVAELELSGAEARIKIEKCPPGDVEHPRLEQVYAYDLTSGK
ncbi:MAG: alkaline phosphatase D family protein [Gammaproteobacteria bacterium]